MTRIPALHVSTYAMIALMVALSSLGDMFLSLGMKRISGEALGVNDKVNELCRLVREARHDLLVMSDSDTRVHSVYLHVIACAFADPQIGAATMVFRSDMDSSLVASLDCLGAGNDFWANTILQAQLQGGLRTTHGATMAVRRSLLLQAGGWESRVNHDSDDHWLGEAIASLGHCVALLPSALWMAYPAQSFPSYLRHDLLRYVRIRTTVPWGYAGFVFTHGLPWRSRPHSRLPTLQSPWATSQPTCSCVL